MYALRMHWDLIKVYLFIYHVDIVNRKLFDNS